jgi:dihydroorotate dehydrogenase electron transfer subunit
MAFSDKAGMTAGVVTVRTPAGMMSDMKHSTTSPRGLFPADVLSNERLCTDHYRLVLRVAGFPASQPGQFVQLQCRPLAEQSGATPVDWPADRPPRLRQAELTDREPLLRRPFSIGGRRERDDACELDLLYRTVGTGTGWLAGVEPGEPLSLLGPLGNSLPIEDKPRAALVGGGVGIPPMLYLAEALAHAGKAVTAFAGARSRHLLPLTVTDNETAEEFDRLGCESRLATDDGTLGLEGTVTDLLVQWHRDSGLGSGDLVVYACGPEPMMRACANLCIDLDLPCYLSLERQMACGMGTCQSCIVKIRDESTQGWSYKLCCTDGPVFEARQVLW